MRVSKDDTSRPDSATASKGRIVAVPEKEHRCKPDILQPELSFVPEGTVYECKEGHTWVAYRQSLREAAMSGCRILSSQWRRETWWEKRKRLKAKKGSPGVSPASTNVVIEDRTFGAEERYQDLP